MKLMLILYIIFYIWYIVFKSNGWIYKDEYIKMKLFICNIKDKVIDVIIGCNVYIFSKLFMWGIGGVIMVLIS